jgi:hypothetical protein
MGIDDEQIEGDQQTSSAIHRIPPTDGRISTAIFSSVLVPFFFGLAVFTFVLLITVS